MRLIFGIAARVYQVVRVTLYLGMFLFACGAVADGRGYQSKDISQDLQVVLAVEAGWMLINLMRRS